MLRFACPNCRATLKADESKAGAGLACPKCSRRLRIPSPTARSPFPHLDYDGGGAKSEKRQAGEAGSLWKILGSLHRSRSNGSGVATHQGHLLGVLETSYFTE